jgi:hypothetical protein
VNACALHRKELALFASEPRDRQLPPKLRHHITQCPQCRNYWSEISALCEHCTSAKDTDTSLRPGFHETWVNQIREERTVAPAAFGSSFPHFDGWPLKTAIVSFLLLMAAIPVLHRPKQDLPSSRPVSVPVTGKPPTLTLLDYRLAESDSALDALMRQQPNQEPPGTSRLKRTYTMLTRSEDESLY